MLPTDSKLSWWVKTGTKSKALIIKTKTSPHNKWFSIVQESVRSYNREQKPIVGWQKFLFGSELYDPYFKPALAAMMTVKEGVIGVISQKH